MRDILFGLYQLHEQDICHRDIKSANILVDGNGRLKIGDLGSARYNKEGDDYGKGKITTYPYRAPEIFAGEKFTKKSDVYSAGIVCWEVLAWTLTFLGIFSNENDTRLKVLSGERPSVDGFPPECVDLIESLWHQDQRQRPSAEEVLFYDGNPTQRL